MFLLFESMRRRRSRPPVWYRERSWYEELLSPLELVRVIPKRTISGRDERMELLRFEAPVQPSGRQPIG